MPTSFLNEELRSLGLTRCVVARDEEGGAEAGGGEGGRREGDAKKKELS